MQLFEAFQACNALNEDTFSISDNGIENLSQFMNDDDVVDTIDVIDPEAETEEELQDSYVGKVIIDCSVCHSKLYKDKSEVIIDEEDNEHCNVGDECPYCYSSDGFKVIGEVSAYSKDEPEDDKVNDDTIDSEITDDVTETDDIEESLNESVNNVNVDTDDAIVNVSQDDNGSVTVTTTPKDNDTDSISDEVITPISDETQNEIENNDIDAIDDEEIDIDIDDFDEESFDQLGESYLKETYQNIDSYKTTKVTSLNNSLKVEGIITFESGNEKPTTFIFESKDITKSGNARFIGENLNITKGVKAFNVYGTVNNGKFISESLKYDYTTKDEQRINGTVTNKAQ